MADIIGLFSPVTGDNPNTGMFASWTLANGDIGLPMPFIDFADRTVQVEGTFGVGGTCVIEGSNDGTNYRTLHDPQGVALSITSGQISTITQVTRWIRPRCTAGDGTTAIVVSMVSRRTNR